MVFISNSKSNRRLATSSVLQGMVLGPVLFNATTLIIWLMGQRVASASLQMMQNCVEPLIHKLIVLPSKRIWTDWRNGPKGSSSSSARKTQSPAPGKEQAYALIYARAYPAGKHLVRKGPGGLSRHRVEHESVVCPCC